MIAIDCGDQRISQRIRYLNADLALSLDPVGSGEGASTGGVCQSQIVRHTLESESVILQRI